MEGISVEAAIRGKLSPVSVLEEIGITFVSGTGDELPVAVLSPICDYTYCLKSFLQ